MSSQDPARIKAANDALARAAGVGEAEFRELADNAPVLIWRSGPDKVIDWFNKPWLDFVGRTLEQEVGFGWAAGLHPDDEGKGVDQYVAAFDARERFSLTYRLRRHDGEYRWLMDNGAPYYRDGAFVGYFGSCIDITEMRELQAHQEVLLYELNHRVKNNLQLIISFLAFSAAGAQTQEAKTLLKAAITRIHGVGAIQEQLHQNPGGAVDLGQYLPSLARAVLATEGGEGARLEVETDSVVVGFQQASNLGLIVNELVTNAIKHGAAVTIPLRLTLRRVGPDHAELTLADGGPGFSQSALHSPNRSKSHGTGLIDALSERARALVVRENHNGAVIRLSFPIEEGE